MQHQRLRTIAGSAIPADLATAAAEASGGDDASADAPPSPPASVATNGAATNGSAETGAVSNGAKRGQQHPVDVRQILSDPGIEGDTLQFLKVSEAYWKVGCEDPIAVLIPHCDSSIWWLMKTAEQTLPGLCNRRGIMEEGAAKQQSERALRRRALFKSLLVIEVYIERQIYYHTRKSTSCTTAPGKRQRRKSVLVVEMNAEGKVTASNKSKHYELLHLMELVVMHNYRGPFVCACRRSATRDITRASVGRQW